MLTLLKVSSRKFLAIAAPLILLTSGVALASMEAGFTAFQQGDYAAAMAAWLEEAEQGDPTAQFNVGQLYRLGKGVSQDDQLAALWYRRAAARGYGPAERNLELMVADGRLESVQGTPASGGDPDSLAARSRDEPGLAAYQQGDFNQAIDAWLPLAAQGDATAQFNLGQLHRLGRGVVQSDTEAVRWYRRAALQGHPMAVHNLSAMLRDQRVPADQRKAIETIVAGVTETEQTAVASAAMAMMPGSSTSQGSRASPPSQPMVTSAASATSNTTVPRVQMLSQPLIAANQATRSESAPPRAATSAPSNQLSIPPTEVADSIPAEPPVPRRRPAYAAEETTGKIAALMPQVSTPTLIDAPQAPRVPLATTPVMSPPAMPESDLSQVPTPPVLEESPPSSVAVATVPEPQVDESRVDQSAVDKPAVDEQDSSTPVASSAVPTRNPTASRTASLVPVAEVLDMNSLVVKAESVPVTTVVAVSAVSAGTGSRPAGKPAPITVAVLDTSVVAPRVPAQRLEEQHRESSATVATQGSSPVGEVHGNDWFQEQNRDAYVVQIMASNHRSHLQSFLADIAGLANPLSLLTTVRGERPWYVLVLGPYQGYSQANRVLEELAEPVKVNGPWIRQVGKIQSAMR